VGVRVRVRVRAAIVRGTWGTWKAVEAQFRNGKSDQLHGIPPPAQKRGRKGSGENKFQALNKSSPCKGRRLGHRECFLMVRVRVMLMRSELRHFPPSWTMFRFLPWVLPSSG
ncbi:unnamed protein product, partial [Discosporangium mesarthrocarpum]